MLVRTEDRFPGHPWMVGLHVGVLNAQQYFPREIPWVELQLDHLLILCALSASFWKDRPVIQDPRLGCWLEAKRNAGKLSPESTTLSLTPSSVGVFRLLLLTTERVLIPERVLQPQVPIIPATTYSENALPLSSLPMSSSTPLSRKSPAREVGRLKIDDRPPTSAIA